MEYKLLNIMTLEKELKYNALKVKMGDRYYYLTKGYVIKIKQWEYDRLSKNSCLHYFTTALRLHFRIEDKIRRISKK